MELRSRHAELRAPAACTTTGSSRGPSGRSTGTRRRPVASAVPPWPNSCRSLEPIWKRPRYWPFWAVVREARTRTGRRERLLAVGPEDVADRPLGGSDASSRAVARAAPRAQCGDRLRQLRARAASRTSARTRAACAARSRRTSDRRFSKNRTVPRYFRSSCDLALELLVEGQCCGARASPCRELPTELCIAAAAACVTRTNANRPTIGLSNGDLLSGDRDAAPHGRRLPALPLVERSERAYPTRHELALDRLQKLKKACHKRNRRDNAKRP